MFAIPGTPDDYSNAGPPSVHTDPKYKVREIKSRHPLPVFDTSSCNISLKVSSGIMIYPNIDLKYIQGENQDPLCLRGGSYSVEED